MPLEIVDAALTAGGHGGEGRRGGRVVHLPAAQGNQKFVLRNNKIEKAKSENCDIQQRIICVFMVTVFDPLHLTCHNWDYARAVRTYHAYVCIYVCICGT